MIIDSPISNIAFYIFNYPVKFYGIIMSFAILTGLSLTIYFFNKDDKNIESQNNFQDSIFYTLIFSIIGARLFYVIGSYNYYSLHTNEILKIYHGGISIYGAILFGIATIFIYSKIKKSDPIKYLDYISLVMPLCQSIGRWGNYFNQEAYGKPASGIIKLFIDKNHRFIDLQNISYYHPTFLYESILDLLLFIFLVIFYKKNKNIKKGTIFYLYLILYSTIRIFVEYYRIDSILDISNIPIATIISTVILIISSYKLYKITKN